MWQDTANNWFQYRSNPDRQSHRGFLGPRWSLVFSLGVAQLLSRSARQASVGVRYILAVWGSFRYHVSSRCCCCLSLLRFGKMFTGFSQTIARSCCKLHKQVVEPGSMCQASCHRQAPLNPRNCIKQV